MSKLYINLDTGKIHTHKSFTSYILSVVKGEEQNEDIENLLDEKLEKNFSIVELFQLNEKAREKIATKITAEIITEVEKMSTEGFGYDRVAYDSVPFFVINREDIPEEE